MNDYDTELRKLKKKIKKKKKLCKLIESNIIDAQQCLTNLQFATRQQNLELLEGGCGPRGNRGDRGEKGDIGCQGLRGDPGSRGSVGEPGECFAGSEMQGPNGVRGEQGERGDDGSPGLMGDQGLSGSLGSTGDKGDRGATGLTGARGATVIEANNTPGPVGKDGEVGPTGEDGDMGDSGIGIPGFMGETGAIGEAGEIGAKGPTGMDLSFGKAFLQGGKSDSTSIGETPILFTIGMTGSVDPFFNNCIGVSGTQFCLQEGFYRVDVKLSDVEIRLSEYVRLKIICDNDKIQDTELDCIVNNLKTDLFGIYYSVVDDINCYNIIVESRDTVTTGKCDLSILKIN
jgi:hypothetical protein